jgi:glycerol-3-phosphate dehydrogenase (NAD(P)+)
VAIAGQIRLRIRSSDVCLLLECDREAPGEYRTPDARHGTRFRCIQEIAGMSRIAIVGSGSWGTALALSLARRGDHSIGLWSHSAAVGTYLPGFSIPPQVKPVTDLASAVRGADIVISAVPSQYVRATYEKMTPFLEPGQIIVSATKGIEDQSFLRMTQVIEQVHGGRAGALSGPSFAQEVAAGAPTAITVAAAESEIANRLQEELSSPNLRIYTNDDVIGVELGGALKNVIAIASGIASGLGLGHNSVAAIITRGVAEITRLAVACGGQRETLAGLSGLGDLVLTCTGPLSRNRSVGIELGRGHKLSTVLAELHGKVAEGVRTTSAALGLARAHGVEMPITEQMAAILEQGKSPQDAIRDLMARPGREE